MHVTIIAKAPLPGEVKTRLCPPCTPQQAAEVAAAALRDTIVGIGELLELLAPTWSSALPPLRPVLLWDGPIGDWGEGFEVVAQSAGTLGDRLAAGFHRLGAGVIIGMEAPAAVPHLATGLRAAAVGLDSLGLATDGGYWMVGLGARNAARATDVFAGVPMSSSRTGLAQLRRFAALESPVKLLPMARDLDTGDDLRAVAGAEFDGELRRTARRVLGMEPTGSG